MSATLLDKTVFKLTCWFLSFRKGRREHFPFGECDADRLLPVLGPRGNRNSLVGRAQAFRSALGNDERFMQEPADLKLKCLCFLCYYRPSTLWRFNAENCFKEFPRLVVHICLLGLWEMKGFPLLSPPAAVLFPKGFRMHYCSLVFLPATSMSHYCRKTSWFAQKLQTASPRSAELFRSSSLLFCWFTSAFFSASNIWHMPQVNTKHSQHRQMFHRRREGPLFPSGEQHSNSKRRAGPYLAEGRRRAHIHHTLHGGGTQIFAAKLERKYPYRELQGSVFLAAESTHSRQPSVAMTKPSLAELDLPITYTSPFPLLFLPELKNESKPSVAQP